jgi:predicted AAA+ superfamily ATPase
MIRRSINLPKNNSFFLFGARSTGKTSLLKQVFAVNEEILFLDLLNDDLFQKYITSPQILKKEVDLMKKRPKWIVLDEVQRVPKLLNVAHQMIESEEKIKFALTGSSSRRLKQKGVNLLAGRAWIRNIYPLTFIELGDDFVLSETLNWGSLPRIFSLQDFEDKVDFLKAYATTYIKTEIQEEQWVRNLEPFIRFLPIAAHMNGKPLNYSSIARDVGAEVPTIKSYFEILEDTLLGFFLHGYNKSVRKQLRLAPKFYFFDLGVKKALHKTLDVSLHPQTSEWGFAFEHLVVCEAFRLNEYYKTDYSFSYLQTKDGFEVDLILEKPAQKPLLIEIKSAEKVHSQDFSKFANFVAEIKGIGYVLSNDSSARMESKIKYLPWKKGLLEIFKIE